MILKALKRFSWSCYNSKNGSQIHDLTSYPVIIVRSFPLLIPFWLHLLYSDTLYQSLSADWHVSARDIWFRWLCLIWFSPISHGGENPTHSKYLEDIIICLFLFALSILCLGLRGAVWFRNRKSRYRQAGTIEGTEETLKKNNVSCVVFCFGFRVVNAELLSDPWTGAACMSAKRVWNIWAIPVDWFAFLVCWFPGIHPVLQELQTLLLWLQPQKNFLVLWDQYFAFN